MRGEIEEKAGVAIRTPAQFLSVQPDRGIRHRAIEHNGEDAAVSVLWKEKRLAIPSGAGDRQSPGFWIQLLVKRTFNRPVMRQAEQRPVRIVKAGIFGAGCISLVEAPICVEAYAPLTGNSDSRQLWFCRRCGSRDQRGKSHRGERQSSQTPPNFSDHIFSSPFDSCAGRRIERPDASEGTRSDRLDWQRE